MCGILAVFSPKRRWPRDVLERAIRTLSHRGPDAEGSWQEGCAYLGHRRLAIIDLATGAQPMQSHDGRFVITYNGELYNFRELRELLTEAGREFRTQSDTEVILEAYRHWGEKCLSHFAGMYAFVIWDREEQRVFAARDRLGIKPLVWTMSGGSLVISSTIEPLLSLPQFERRLDYESLRDILVFDYIPSPRTILRGVSKLEPAHYLTWHPGQAGPMRTGFWTIPSCAGDEGDRTQGDLAELVESSLAGAVKRQMVSDVPIGAFLSGGIDSSLVAYFMSRNSTRAVRTFTVAFADRRLDESRFARLVAHRLGTDHTELPADEVGGDDVATLIGRLDEPFADPSLIPTCLLSALTRNHVSVALSGDGGDEVFGGYARYLRAESPKRWRETCRAFCAKFLQSVMRSTSVRPQGVGRLYRALLSTRGRIRYDLVRYGDFPVFRKDLSLVLSPQALSLARPERFLEPWERRARVWGERYTTDVLMRTDLSTYLSENCLVKTDRASMMSSLEVRVPFLDESVIDAVVPLAARSKVQGVRLKSLLLPIARKHLPREVWDRPKHGFTVPLSKYLTDWSPMIESIIDWGATNAPLFDCHYLRRLVRLNAARHNVGRDLWAPLVVLIWLQKRGRISL